jgi:hypothetical protein
MMMTSRHVLDSIDGCFAWVGCFISDRVTTFIMHAGHSLRYQK